MRSGRSGRNKNTSKFISLILRHKPETIGITLDEHEGIYTHEGNEHVPTWNHEIILEELQGNRCRYTDKVDIDAGWKTIFVWMWANCFYTHRQKKWIKLLSRKI